MSKANLRVALRSWQRLKLKIKVITRKGSPIPFEERIQRLNSLMRGWLGYFQLGKIWGKLRILDGWIRNRLRYCIWKQWKKPNRRMRFSPTRYRSRDGLRMVPLPYGRLGHRAIAYYADDRHRSQISPTGL